MKIHNGWAFLVGLAALIVAVLFAVDYVVAPRLHSTGIGFFIYLFILAMLEAFKSPEKKAKDVLRGETARKAYRNRFGRLAPLMEWLPVIILFGGIALAWIVTEDRQYRSLIFLGVLITMTFIALWMRNLVSEETEKLNEAKENTSE